METWREYAVINVIEGPELPAGPALVVGRYVLFSNPGEGGKRRVLQWPGHVDSWKLLELGLPWLQSPSALGWQWGSTVTHRHHSVLCALWFGLGPDFTSVLLSVPLTVVVVPGGARLLRNPVWREFACLCPGCDQKWPFSEAAAATLLTTCFPFPFSWFPSSFCWNAVQIVGSFRIHRLCFSRTPAFKHFSDLHLVDDGLLGQDSFLLRTGSMFFGGKFSVPRMWTFDLARQGCSLHTCVFCQH